MNLVTLLKRKYAAIEMCAAVFAGLLPVHRFRVWILRAFGATISNSAVLYHGFQVRGARKLVIMERVSVGDGAILDARGGLTLGNDVNLSTRVQIWTAQHDWTSPDFAYQEAAVSIGDRAWLGPGVIVLPGSTVGEGAVVAAGAVVRGQIAPYTLVGGVPAKKIADRPRDLSYRLGTPAGKSWWW